MINVYAAVIIRNEQVLLSSKIFGNPPTLKWEFPGGKIEPHESPRQCLQRELREELALSIRVVDQIHSCQFDYPGKHVKLHFYRCLLVPECQTPIPQEHQQCMWVPLAELNENSLLPADREFAKFIKDSAINND